jgi:AcrR family transcriptional regulator
MESSRMREIHPGDDRNPTEVDQEGPGVDAGRPEGIGEGESLPGASEEVQADASEALEVGSLRVTEADAVETPEADAVEAPDVGPRNPEEGAEALEGAVEARGVRPPKQERSRRTLDRIVTAAQELLRESGLEGTTVSSIVERAGTSVGSFYARFSGKEELVRYLRDRHRGVVQARWDAGADAVDWAALPLGDRVMEAVALLVRSYREDWGLSRVLHGAGRPGEEEGWWARDFREHVLMRLTPALGARRTEAAHPYPEVAVETGCRMVAGAIREAVELNDPGGKGGGPDSLGSLARELARAWTAYLESGEGAAREEEPVAAIEDEAELKSTPEETPVPKPATPPDVDFFDPWG